MMTLSKLAELTQGILEGEDAEFNTVSIDSRTLISGDLFVAVKGDNFDGHDYVTAAQERGAVACLVERKIATSLPQVIVKNTRIALGKLASARRQAHNIPLIAVTGSCGKTTTRSMLESIVAQMGKVLASTSSFNNDIGVPLTLLKLDNTHQYAVLETGMNHFGELAYIAEIARPNVAIITNIGPVHLEGVGDINGVAKAKSELFSGLATEGVAVFEADSPYASQWRDLLAGKKILTFGLTNRADVWAKDIQVKEMGRATFTLVCDKGEIGIELPLLGVHNVLNALAAAAATRAIGANLNQIKAGLEHLTPVTKRLVRHEHATGAIIVDDTYNANPASVRAAMAVLIQSKGMRKILVLGEMRELGEQSAKLHFDIGQAAKEVGIDELYTVGELTTNSAKAFGPTAHHFTTKENLIAALKPHLQPQTCILIKGSRGMKMEEVVNALL